MATCFERERQLLAQLDHPSPARLLDAGVTGHGMPYLATNMFIHRDLKPWSIRSRKDARPRGEVTTLEAVGKEHDLEIEAAQKDVFLVTTY